MSMFEKATKQKLRFSTTAGNVTTEDLWDMPLEGRVSLDNLARSLNKQIKEQGEESFVKKPSTVSSELQLKFDIVKHIIDAKIAYQERAEKAAATRKQKQHILDLMGRKKDEELQSKSLEELEKILEELEG